jgi:nitroreductase
MDALTALHSRNSANLLGDPAPTAEQLEAIYQAGLRACDHACLKPWKFLLIDGDARLAFGDLMVEVKTAMDGEIDEITSTKIRAKPLRAPTIIVVAASIKEHPKVPEIEQVLSAGAAAQLMMVAAHAQGLGAIWRSGSMMFAPEMRAGLGLEESDQIVGFIYLGTPNNVKPLPERASADFVRVWEPESDS